MEPNTAINLKERKNNRLRDFVSMAGPLGVTHFLIFSRTDTGTNLRIARGPRGPTLSFRVHTFSLIRDIMTAQARPKSPGAEYLTSPLLILNNFNGPEKELKLMSTMLQNMFPPINVQTMHLSSARRVVLINRNAATGRLDFRHYAIIVKPIGVSKSIKRVVDTVEPKKGSLSTFQDVGDYILQEAAGSDSEFEDVEANIDLPSRYVGRNNRAKEQRAVRLVEIGPRMELELMKVQEGLCDGPVLYHRYVNKTAEEVKQQEAEIAQRQKERDARRKKQEENIKRKDEERKENKRKARREQGLPSESEGDDDDDEEEEQSEQDDEFEYEDRVNVRQPEDEDSDDDKEVYKDASESDEDLFKDALGQPVDDDAEGEGSDEEDVPAPLSNGKRRR